MKTRRGGTVTRRLEIRYVGMEDDRAKRSEPSSRSTRRRSLLRSRYFPRLPRPMISIPGPSGRGRSRRSWHWSRWPSPRSPVCGTLGDPAQGRRRGAATPSDRPAHVPAKGHAGGHRDGAAETPPPASPLAARKTPLRRAHAVASGYIRVSIWRPRDPTIHARARLRVRAARPGRSPRGDLGSRWQAGVPLLHRRPRCGPRTSTRARPSQDPSPSGSGS